MKHNKILVLFAHPALHKSRVNLRLLNSLEELEGVTINRLYDEYPDFHLNVKREQALLVEHDIIIWQHPFYWYSSPAIVKEWIDLVLEHNFAYGRKGTALQGKRVMSAITTGGRFEAYMEKGYNHFSIRQFLSPFEQTVRLCRMEYLPPFVVHGTHMLEEGDIVQFAEDYRNCLTSNTPGQICT